jgi:hypothetical protein
MDISSPASRAVAAVAGSPSMPPEMKIFIGGGLRLRRGVGRVIYFRSTTHSSGRAGGASIWRTWTEGCCSALQALPWDPAQSL